MGSRKIFFLVSFVFVFGRLAGQECKSVFTGRVTDESGAGLPGVLVLLSPGNIGATTNESGEFRIGNLCPDRYHVHVRLIGFEEVAFDIQVDQRPVVRTIPMREAIVELGEVVVQHHDETLTEHSSNYAVVEMSDLLRLSGKSLAESLRSVPGVSTVSTGPGIVKPVIHGLHSNRILILNHGIPQEGQQWGIEHAPEIDPFIASNLVVVKDASAIKYGPGALGGVVIVNPPALPESGGIGGSVQTMMQTNGRMGVVSGTFEGGVGQRHGWGWRAQATAKRAGDFHTPDYSLTNTGVRELNFSASAGYHGDARGFDVYYSRFQSSLGILKGTAVNTVEDLIAAMTRQQPLYTTDFSYGIGEPRQEVSHDLFKVTGHFVKNRGDWRFQYGYQRNGRREFDIRMGGLSDIPSLDLSLQTHTLDAEWETVHSEQRTISVGVNMMYQDNDNIPGTQRIPFIPDFNTWSSGVFTVAKLYKKDFSIDVGARLDYRTYDVKGFDFRNEFYAVDFSFFNASATAGVKWQPSIADKWILNVSIAWRPPHVSELFSIGVHQSAASIEYGLLLDPQTNEVSGPGRNFGVEQALKAVATYAKALENFSIEATPYVNYIFNYIHLRPFGVTRSLRGAYPFFRYRQTDALFAGVDVASSWLITPGITLNPKAAWLRAVDRANHDVLPMIPPNRFELALRYEKDAVGWLSGVYVQLESRYVAKQRHAPRTIAVEEIVEGDGAAGATFDFMAPPEGYFWGSLGAGGGKKFKRCRLDVNATVENLFDETYREYTSRIRYYADEPGRNFVLSMKLIF